MTTAIEYTICPNIDSALVTEYVPKEEARKAWLRYLSEFVLIDKDSLELRLPKMTIPQGFHLTHNRCSKRCLYEISEGFAVILSEESSWEGVEKTEENRTSVCELVQLQPLLTLFSLENWHKVS